MPNSGYLFEEIVNGIAWTQMLANIFRILYANNAISLSYEADKLPLYYSKSICNQLLL